jgi:hypothetical protein
MKKIQLIELIREIINEELAKIEEAEPGTRRATLGWGAGAAKQQADQQGLEYYGFGRYGKNHKITHHSVNGKLEPVDKPAAGAGTEKISESEEEELDERTVASHEPPRKMSKDQIKGREGIGKKLLKSKRSVRYFKDKFGDDWKSYLWAVSTNKALASKNKGKKK